MKLLDEFLVFSDTIKKHDKYCFIGTIERSSKVISIKNYQGRILGLIYETSCHFYQEKIKLTTSYYNPNCFTISLIHNRRIEEKKYEPNFLHEEELIKVIISKYHSFELLESYFNLVNIVEPIRTRGVITNLVEEEDETILYSHDRIVGSIGEKYGYQFINLLNGNKVYFTRDEKLTIQIEMSNEKFSYIRDVKEYKFKIITRQELIDLVLNFSRIWFYQVESLLKLELV